MDDVPFEDRHVPRVEIDWERSTWWWHPLSRAIHPAIRMLALVTSLIAIWIAQLGIQIGHWVFRPDWNGLDSAQSSNLTPFQSQLSESIAWLPTLMVGFESFGVRELAFVTFVLLWLSLVLGIFGGVLARRGLVELGQRTIAPWGESLRVVLSRWQSYLWATGMHLVGIAALLLPFVVLGALCRLGSVGATIGGVLLIAMFPLVFALGRFALSMFICFPLSVCAITAETKADAFEGFSRSNAYLFQRPVVTVLCGALLILAGYVGEQLVVWTLTAGWALARGSFFMAGGNPLPQSVEPFIDTGNWLKWELIRAFWFSFFWSGMAAIYLILRRSVDHTELDEIDTPTNAVEASLPEIPQTPPDASTPDSDAVSADTVRDAPPPTPPDAGESDADGSKPDGAESDQGDDSDKA